MMKAYPTNDDSPYTMVEAAVMLFALVCGAALGLAALPPIEPQPLRARVEAGVAARPASQSLDRGERR